jgi:hypothetical protein
LPCFRGMAARNSENPGDGCMKLSLVGDGQGMVARK